MQVPRLAIAAAVVVGAAVRLVTWSVVFGADGVRFMLDGHPYYHVLRTKELLAGQLHWFDAGLNHPFGAESPRPPLFDVVLAAAGWVTGLGSPSGEDVERAAALVPVLLGVATLPLVALLAREIAKPW